MTRAYVLLPEAEADLRAIIRYTRAQWGDAQTRSYVATLTRCIEDIADGERTAKDLSGIHPGLRMVHCQHHYIFCLPRENAAALVVAILHERMDLMTRLADRLK